MENDSEEVGFNVHWTAPEILIEGMFSKRGDIFSFAMLMIEVHPRWFTMSRVLTNCCHGSIQVFTCAAPFVDQSYLTAMLDIVQGRRPPRPKNPIVTGCLWRLIQRCWNQDPRLRPEAWRSWRNSLRRQFLVHYGYSSSIGLNMSLCVGTLQRGKS